MVDCDNALRHFFKHIPIRNLAVGLKGC